MARRTRNEILHDANYELSEDKLKEYLDQFKEVLEEVKKDSNVYIRELQHYIDASIEELDKLKMYQIEINLAEELQILKDHAMEEDARIIEKAQQQKDKELQYLEQRQKQAEEAEEQLQFLGRLRLARINQELKPKRRKRGFKLTSWSVSLDIELGIIIYVNGKNDESSKETIQRAYDFLFVEVENHKKKHVKVIYDNTAKAIHSLLKPIFNTEDTLVKEIMQIKTDGHPCVSMKIKCCSESSLEQLLVVFHGNKFQNRLRVLRKCLEEEKDGKTAYDVKASFSPGSMNTLRKELYERGIFEGITYDFKCERHDGTQNTWYCSDHDTFCCSSCMEKEHGTCDRLTQVMSDNTYQNATQRGLSVKRDKGEYDVRHEELQAICCVCSICILPNGEFLLCDSRNASLKKLNSSFMHVSNIFVDYDLQNICYIGNGKAVVSMNNCKIVFVNVSVDLMSIEKEVQFDHSACCLACHGDRLYTSDTNTVRVMETDGTQERVIYKSSDNTTYQCMAVSDDGQKIYITDTKNLMVIDNKGKHLFTLQTNDIRRPSSICCIGDGSIIVIDEMSNEILHIDCKGKNVLGKVVTPNNITRKRTLCYDRRHSRLIVGVSKSDNISVFKLQYAEHK